MLPLPVTAMLEGASRHGLSILSLGPCIYEPCLCHSAVGDLCTSHSYSFICFEASFYLFVWFWFGAASRQYPVCTQEPFLVALRQPYEMLGRGQE